ncbi:MAG TPA: beta-ketoacyl-ACP synthase III [Casimicrobiaceae bacterium]
MSLSYSRIVGTGSYLPSRIVSNAELAASIDTSDAWIKSMTGIVQRHIAGDGESTTDMAVIASSRALANAGVQASAIDLVIVATITPDLVFPSTAALLQARLGARNVGAVDLSAACSGFMYGLAMADAMIASGRIRTALVVGAETMSRLLDWTDRSTCVLFGDGAAAVVLVSASAPGVASVRLHADGATPEVLCTPSKKSRFLHMEGGPVFKFAVKGLVEAGQETLDDNGVSADAVDWLIPHQANQRIIDACAHKLCIARDKVVVTVDRHANTSAASIPLALDFAVADGRIRAGNTVLLLSVGGGFTWAGALIKWS